jgi:fumarate reductase subunit D
MDAELWGMSTTESDHDVTLTLSGDVESLRPRLVEAVAKRGYKIITEQPLQAKRAARGSARWDCSFEALDYPRKLTVALKPLNDLATLATFSYELKAFSGLTRGDRQTLQREAEALAALTMQGILVNSCTACGTEVTDDSRFCRRCGAPLDVDVAEMEVLRLTEGARRGHHNLVIGIIVLFVALLLPLILIWVDTAKAIKVVALISSLTGVAGLFTMLQGMWQLHRTLNPSETKKISSEPLKSFAAPQTKSLPPRPAQLSVTEGTTELLAPEEEKRVAVAVERKKVDTAEVK